MQSGVITRTRISDDEVRAIGGDIKVTENGMTARKRKYHRLVGACLNSPLGVYDSSVLNAERALKERYFFVEVAGEFHPALKPKPGNFGRAVYCEFRNAILDQLPEARVWARQETVASFSGLKRRVYERAMEDLYRNPLRRSDAHLKMFVKFEKQHLGKAPRCINPRGPRYTLELARYLKHAEKLFYRSLNEHFGYVAVVKGYNASDTARYIRESWDVFGEPVAIGFDAKKFDMHVSVEALRFEHSFYEQYYKSRRLSRLLSWQRFNRGRAWFPDGELEFMIKGTRSSGDINTSLGNVLIMISVLNAGIERSGARVRIVNNGDDSVLICESSEAKRLVEAVLAEANLAGFRMTQEPIVSVFEHLEFCQTKPVFIGGEWRMVRNLDAVLKKDGLCLHPCRTLVELKKWMWAVGLCNSILHSGVPVLSSMAQWFLRNGQQTSDRHLKYVFNQTSMLSRIEGLKNVSRVDDLARVSFYEAFGILPDLQLELEDYWERLAFSTDVGELSTLDLLFPEVEEE